MRKTSSSNGEARGCVTVLLVAMLSGCFSGSGSLPPAPGVLPPLALSNASFQQAGLAAVQWEAYWYSRFNLGALVMKSGNGELFMPDPARVADMVALASDDLSQATPPSNPALFLRVYDRNNPALVQADNGDPMDFSNGRWGPAPDTATTSYEAAAWTMIKELQWARLFHVDGHFGAPETPNRDGIPGAQQRFAGLVLFVEAFMQSDSVQNDPARFTRSTAGQYVMLWALSDLTSILSTPALPHSKTNRYRDMIERMAAPATADQVAAGLRARADGLYATLPTPVTVRERSLAIQALVWYAWACETNSAAVRTRIAILCDALRDMAPAGPTELALAIRGLIEGYRMTGDRTDLDRTAVHFGALLDGYDPPHGVFKSRSTYRSEDVAAILGALNSLRLFAGDAVDQAKLRALLVNFFEGVVNQSGLQISAPPMSMLPGYEMDLINRQEVLVRYPLLPAPPAAGGPNGIAPVFAAAVTLSDGRWTRSADTDIAGAMHLANEMLWLHNGEVNGFPDRIPDLRVTDPDFRDAGMAAVQWEAYWYSRYDLGHLVMRSGNGDTFMPNPAVIGRIVSETSDDLSTAAPNPTAALIDRAYDGGDPSFLNASNGDPNDYTNHRWAAIGGDPGSTSRQESQGWTMLKEIEWSRQFHVDSHFGLPETPNQDGIPGAQQRFGGGVLFVEAFLQYRKYRTLPALFDDDLAGRYVMLAAVSDLGKLLAATTLPHSASNRYREIVETMTGMSSDSVATDILNFADTLYLGLLGDPDQPDGVREIALAIQALTWYADATTSHADSATNRLLALAGELETKIRLDSTDRGYTIRALLDAYRASADDRFRQSAAAIFGEMMVDFDGFHGVFRSRTVYTPEDVAAVLGGLNSLTLFGGTEVDQKLVRKMLASFFESVVNLSGLQIAAPPTMMIAQYERDQLNGVELFFRYPSLPMPPQVPGSAGHGTAPVFAAEVTFDPASATWSAQQTAYDTAGGMHLSNEMLWFHATEVDGFPLDAPGALPPAPPAPGGGGGTPPPPPTGPVVSFAADVEPILAANCACHRNGNRSGGFSQDTYEGVLAGGNNNATNPEVIPGNGAGSLYYQKVSMDSPPVGSRMPLGGPFLSLADQQTIKDWIDQGANR